MNQTAATGHIYGLHAAADAEQREISLLGETNDVQLKAGATLAHDGERKPLTLTIQCWWKIRPASGDEKSVELAKNLPSRGPIGVEWKDQRDPSQLFDGQDLAGTQKVGGLAPTPLLPVTGVEVWCDADDRFHQLADGLRSSSRLCSIFWISDSQEADGPIALEVIRGNEIGTIQACLPDRHCGFFIQA